MKYRNFFQFLNHIFTGAEYYNGQKVHIFAGHKYVGAYNWLPGEELNDKAPKYKNMDIHTIFDSDDENSSIFNPTTHPEYFI